VHRRDRDPDLLGDGTDLLSVGSQALSHFDTLSNGLVKVEGVLDQARRGKRLASGSEMGSDAGTARPVRMLAHPLALTGSSAARVLAAPLLTAWRPPRLISPVSQGTKDRFVVPSSWRPRVR
jgi:hypothetical protein